MSREFTVEQSNRLDHVLRQESGFSVREAKHLIKEGNLRVNGHLVKKPAFQVRPGDRIRYSPSSLSAKPKDIIQAEEPAVQNFLEILYEDECVLILNKPSGILSVPTASGKEDSLQDFSNRYLESKEPRKKAHAVHRLDRDASGVLIFAKEMMVRENLMKQFKTKKVKKSYLALVQKKQKDCDSEGQIDILIDDNRPQPRVLVHEGKPAKTKFRVLDQNDHFALVQARTLTGRRHQVRVHLAQTLGAILGDRLYNEDSVEKRKPVRLMLHGESIEFHHPKGGELLGIQAPLPTDFLNIQVEKGLRV